MATDEKTQLKDVGADALARLSRGKDEPASDFDAAAQVARDRLKNARREAEIEAELNVRVEGEVTPEEAMEIRRKKKARITQVLSRGILGEKLKSIIREAVPDGYAGKFVRNDSQDIIRAQNLGFGFKYREGVDAVALGVHATPDGKIRVGDVLLMTITKEDQEILREVRTERMVGKLTKAKKEYIEKASGHAGGPQSFDESQTVIDKGRIIDRR